MAIAAGAIEAAIRFHGHSCPGLAIGIRASELALEAVGRADDEEILAVVETDMCGVDAIQFLTGCTFGKGNLIFLDHGKNAFTFYRRRDGKALRIVTRPDVIGRPDDTIVALRKKQAAGEPLTTDEEAQLAAAVAERTRDIMEMPLEQIFDVQPAAGPAPTHARIMASVTCEGCGEMVMESRARLFMGETLCLPCFEEREKRL